MNKIDWNSFRVRNDNHTNAFEELCYMIFCRRHKFSEGIEADFNQAALKWEGNSLARFPKHHKMLFSFHHGRYKANLK